MPRNQQEIIFHDWIEIKKRLHFAAKIVNISEGEIWWCGVGKNVGVEINGKHESFSRPVLIYKKLSRLGFLGIPLSTKEHVGSWYIPFEFNGKNNIAVLSQIKIISVFRLYERMGEINEKDFERVREGFNRLYCK